MRLLLLRHAKSDRSTDLDDHDRPLSGRGLKAAPVVARFMERNGYVPEAVLCSTALRTRQTLDLLLPMWQATPKVQYDRGLYVAEWRQLLKAVRKIASRASPLLLVGHNPGIEQFAAALAREPAVSEERAHLQRMTEKFPTAGLAVLDFEISTWGSLGPGLGRLVEFVRPKDLAGEAGGQNR